MLYEGLRGEEHPSHNFIIHQLSTMSHGETTFMCREQSQVKGDEILKSTEQTRRYIGCCIRRSVESELNNWT